MAQEFTPEEVAARLTTAGPREFTPEEVAERLGSLTPRPIRSKERSWGDAALDVPAVGLSGVGSLLRVPGQLIKLAPGLQGVGEALEAPGKAIAEFGEGLKSEGLKVREALRSEAISEAEKEGILSEFVTALKYTIKDPALLSSFFIEQLPLLIGPAGAAKAVQIAGMGAVRAAGKGLTGEAAELATKEAAKSLGKRAAGAAVGAGTAMQTADIASETFDRAYDVAIKQGMSKEEANDAALNAARLAAPGAALTSLIATKGLAKLGGAAIERRLAGLPGTGRLRTAGGEAVSEGLEEAGGALAGNIGVRTVDPTQSLTAGVGSAAGLGVLGGGVLGGVLGGKARPELAPGQLEGENLYQTARRLHTEIGELDALAEKAKEQENRQLVELKTDAEVANLYRTEGVEGVERYQKELLQKSVAVEATPEEREQAKQASSAATKLMKQIDTSNVIAHRDLMAMGVSQKDRLYKELIGKDMVADSSPIINSFAKALSRPDLSQQQRENISAALTNINEYVGSGGVDSRNVGESVRRSLGLVGVAPERPAARGVEGTAPAGVAPTEEYAGEPLGRAAVKPSPIGEDIEKAPRAAPTAPITEEVQAPPAAPAAEAVARREPTQATEESAVEKFDPEEVQKARVPEYKSRERLIEMPIDEFLQLADTVTKREPLSFVRQKMDNARDLVRRNVPFSSLPMLMYSDGRVDGHEGRHRALALREAGYKTMPVRLRSSDIRWDRQNDPSDPDYIRQWPTRLQAQENAANPNFSIPFPVKREESARPYEPVKRSLKPETEKRAEEILRQQDEEERQAKQAPETAEPVAEKTRVEQFAEARKDLVNQLDGVLKRILAKYGLKDVKLNINEAMEDEGSYARQIITLALNVDNPVRVLRHESIHALKDMGFFAPAQWNALVKRANEEWIDVLKNTVYNEATGASRYDAYQDLFAAEGANKGLKGDALTKYINESIVEEAIADAFGAYDTGKPPAGMIAATLTRMRKLFKAIKEAFGIVGIDTAEDVFGKIEEGKLKPSSEILETAAKAVKPSVSERVSLAPKGIPKDIWKQHERARLLEEKHFGATEPRQKSAATRSWRTLNKMVTRYAGNDKAALDMMVKMDTISGIREAIADDDGQMLAIYKVTDPELYAQETGLETPKSTAKLVPEQVTVKPSVRAGESNAWQASPKDREDALKMYEDEGFLPYVSQGFLDVPLDGAKYSLQKYKPEKHLTFDPVLNVPINKDGTITLYYHTTKSEAVSIGNNKVIPANGRNRIYLTNESNGADVLRNRGNFDQNLDGSSVLIYVTPDLLQMDQQYDNGRVDLYIPLAQGEYFNKKMKTQSIQKARTEAITTEFSYDDHEEKITSAIEQYKAASADEKKVLVKRAKDLLKKQHNVSSLLSENGKLEKTRMGEYDLSYDGLPVASQGLGLASAQKITEKSSTCPRSAICEGLCLGETSGGNFMFGGAASEDVGDIQKSAFRAGARMMQYLKTEALIVHPKEFAILLQSEIDALRRWSEKPTQRKKNAETGKRETIAKEIYAPAVRLNVTSDFRPSMFRGVIDGNPDVMFYDYTKINSDAIADNHHITYSSTGFGQIVDGERVFFKNKAGQYDHNWKTVRGRLNNGFNVAMAFSSKSGLPKTLTDEETGVVYRVLDGDLYDARFLDQYSPEVRESEGRGVIVGLRNKAGTLSEKNATQKTGGFFVHFDPKQGETDVLVPDQSQFQKERRVIPVAEEKLSLRTFKDLFDKAADIPQSEGVEIIRENWIGGVSGIGERNSAYDLPRVEGGRQYMNDVQDLIRNELGDTFKGYRLMHVDELEEIMSGSMGSDLASFTLLPEVAQKFSSVAALGDIPRDQLAVVEMNLTPEHIWMFGHRGEREVVVNYGEGYSTAEVIATPLEGEKPSLRTPDITQFPPTVRDENFKRWSRNAPLVLAEDALDYNFQDGKPFVAQSYHGTNAEEDFTVFSTDKLGLQTGAESADMGYFSTSSPEVAGSYAANLGVGRALGLATYGSADLKNDPEAKRLLNAVRDAEKASAKAYYDAVDDVINEIRKEGKFDLDELPKDSVRSFAGRFVDQNNYPGYQDRKAKIDAAQQAVDDAGADLTQYIFGYEASKIPQRIMPLYVRMSNPKVYDAEGKSPIEFAISERIREAKKDGHDGIVFKNIADPSPVAVHYVSFNNADLKSAIGNIGTFDEQDDILRSLRSPTNPQFKFWFGNSKVVDENGEPKVMYHGTGKDYEILSTARRAAGAIFVSDEPQFAEKFAKDTFARASAEAATGVGIDDEAFKQGVDKAIAQIRKDYGRDPMGRTLVAEVRKGYNEANAEAQEYLRNAFKDVMPAGPNIIPVYIKSEYPFDYENDEHVAAVRRVSETKLTAEALKTGNWEAIEDNEIQAAIRVLGFDGFYVKEQGKRSLGVYDPNQVKSVFNEAPTERPELRMSLRGSITPQLEKTLNKIVPKTYRPNRFQRILDSISGDGFTAARAQIINRYEALARLDRAVAQQIKQAGGVQQLADQKAESAALFSDLGAGLLETAMGAHDRWGGAPVFRNGMTTISNFGGKIKGPIRIFKPLSDLKDPDAFRMYQLWSSVKRGKRLTVEGRESAIDAADIAVVDAFATNPGNANIVKLFERVQKDWLAYNDALVKFMEDTGVISKAMGKAFTEHGDYFPFYRLANDQDVVGPKMFTSIGNVKPPKKLKGGEAPLGDFFENIVLNSRAAIQAGIKNVASQRATEQALRVQGVVRLASQPTVKQTGANSWDVFDGNLKIGEVDAGSLQDAQLAADRQHKRPSSIQINMYRVMEKGNEVFYRSADPLFIDALKSLNMPDLPFLGALFSGPANLLRNLVTKDPAFMLANMMRDSLAAYVTTGVNMTPVVDTLKNFTVAIAGKSPEMQRLYAAGVLGGYDYSVKSKDAAATFEKRLREVSGAKTIGETLATPFTSLWGALEKGTQASDAATRIEMYKKTLAKTGNEAEAYWQALEVMNFNRHGSNPVIRIMTAAIPFLNARMQGLDLLYRKAIYPIYGKDATDAEIQNMKTFWVRGMTMASLSVLYWMMVHDDEDYKSQEQETRDNYWFVPGLGVKIPIPFEIGVLFKVVPERIAELAWGEDTSKDFRESMTRNLINTFRVNPIPQAVLPLYETIVDKSLYTGRAIVSRGMENIAPEYQIGPNTSRIAEVAGKAVGYSPMKIDHLIRGYTGTLGQYMADLIGAAYEVSADNPKPSKRIEQLPIIRRFATDPEARGKLTAFYELKNAVDEAVRTSNMLEKTMQLEELIKYQEDNAQILAMQDYIKDLDKSLKELRDTRKEILSMPMDPDDKRDTLVSIGQMERMLVDNIKDLRAMAFK